MPDPFIGLPVVIGSVLAAAVVKGVTGHNRKKQLKRYYAELATQRQEEIRQQRQRAAAAIKQVTENRVTASKVAARAIARYRLSEDQRIAVLRAVAAEVNRINATLEAKVHDGRQHVVPHGKAMEGHLDGIIREYVRRRR